MTHPPTIKKVYGPPGTGKTTYIINRIKNLTQNQYFLKEVCCSTYTNTGIETMVSRITMNMQTQENDLAHFKTIHALCFSLLGLKPEQVADKKSHIDAFFKAYPEYGDADGSAHLFNLNQMNLNRNRMIPVTEWQPHISSLWTKWSKFLNESNLMDYTMMLEEVLGKKFVLPVLVMFIDEAQDLTKLQFEVVKLWAQSCDQVTLVGDPDQAIFGFNGAAPEEFDAYPCDEEIVLNQSYRVPPAVHAVAMRALDSIVNRKPISYLPFEGRGPGEIIYGSIPDLSLPGSHAILCRTNRHTLKWRAWLLENKVPFKNDNRPDEPLWNPMGGKNGRAARTYAYVFFGHPMNDKVRWGDAVVMLQMLRAKGLFKKGFTKKKSIEDPMSPDIMMSPIDVMEKMGIDTERNITLFTEPKKHLKLAGQTTEMLFAFLDDCWANEEIHPAFKEEPRVGLGTIHSYKGDEADHVWLDVRTCAMAQKEIMNDPSAADVEWRIRYVAITRARETFGELK